MKAIELIRFAMRLTDEGTARLVRAWPDEWLAAHPLGTADALVALTHDPRIDDRAIRAYCGFRPYCPDHLPVIGDFWESVLFGTGVYAKHRRNPLQVHGEIDEKRSLEAPHFNRWLAIFFECVTFAVAPTKVLAFGKGEPFTQTRYRF